MPSLLLALALLQAGPAISQERLSALLPAYPRATEPAARLGDRTEANGVPMCIQAFRTSDSPAAVLEFYAQALAARHLPIRASTSVGLAQAAPGLVALDPRDETEVTVTAVPRDGQTLVLLGLADMAAAREAQQAKAREQAGGFPDYPGARDRSALASSDGERRTYSVHFTTADGLGPAAARLKALLAEQGYALAESHADARSATLDFARGDSGWHITLVSDGARTAVLAVGRR